MLVLGIILILLAAGLAAAFLASGPQEVTLDSGLLDVTLSTLTIYFLGAITLLLLVAGLGLLRAGTRRAGHRRRKHKELNRLSARLEAHEAQQRAETDPSPTETSTDPVDDGNSRG